MPVQFRQRVKESDSLSHHRLTKFFSLFIALKVFVKRLLDKRIGFGLDRVHCLRITPVIKSTVFWLFHSIKGVTNSFVKANAIIEKKYLRSVSVVRVNSEFAVV